MDDPEICSVYFEKLCKELKKSGTFFKTCTDFNVLTSNLDRIQYISKLKELENLPLIPEPFSKCSSSCPTILLAAWMSIKSAQYGDALSLFNTALSTAPYIPVEEFVEKQNRVRFCKATVDCTASPYQAALAGRAEVLSKMGRFKEAMAELEHLLRYDDSDIAHAFYLSKKARILLDDKRHKEAWEVCNEGKIKFASNEAIMNDFIFLLEDSKRNYKKMVKKGIRVSSAAEIDCVPSFSFGAPIPEIKDINPLIPCASASIDVSFDKDQKRTVIAASEIAPGEVLITESPFVYGINGPYQKRCFHCLKPNDIVVPCKTCRVVPYCSEDCRSADVVTHGIECPIMGYLTHDSHDVGDVHIALRVMVTVGCRTLYEMFKNSDTTSNKKGFREDGVYDSMSYSTILDLDLECPESWAMYTFSKATQAYMITKLLFEQTSFWDCPPECEDANSDRYPEEFLLFVASLILRHALSMEFCALGIFQANCTHQHQNGTFLATEHRLNLVGWGLYGFSGLLKHSCSPNAIAVYYGKNVVIRAVRLIHPGDLITLNKFLSPSHTTAIKERQQLQIKQYKFKCECQACAKNWPTLGGLPPDGPALFRVQIALAAMAAKLSLKESPNERKIPNTEPWLTRSKTLLFQSVPSKDMKLVEVFIEFLTTFVFALERPNYVLSEAEESIEVFYKFQGNTAVKCVDYESDPKVSQGRRSARKK